MCGLFGWQWTPGKLPNGQIRGRLGKALAKANDARGGQAWGVFGGSIVLKGLGKAADHTHRYVNLNSMFGHSRYATHGDNCIENAHPFVKDGFALSHNGVMGDHEKLNRKYSRNFEVDSQHILQHLIDGLDFSELTGYGTIIWAKADEPEKIYMGRMNDRAVLGVAQTEHGVVWSSDESALKRALREAELDYEHTYRLDPGTVLFAEGGSLYVATEHASIKISDSPAVRSWESYGSSYTPTVGQFGGYSSSMYFCNIHFKRYTQCSCPGSDFQSRLAGGLLVKIDWEQMPVDGQKYEPKKGNTSPKTEGGATGSVAVPLSEARGSSSASTGPAAGTSTDPTTKSEEFWQWYEAKSKGEIKHPYFCPVQGCVKPWVQCGAHVEEQTDHMLVLLSSEQTELPLSSRPTAPAQISPAPAPAPKPKLDACEESEWLEYVAAAQAEADEADGVSLKQSIIYELAEDFLQAECGIPARAFDGMSKEDILRSAVESGFDGEQEYTDLFAVNKVKKAELQEDTEVVVDIAVVPPVVPKDAPHAANHAAKAKAGVLKPPSGNEPTDGRASQAVG